MRWKEKVQEKLCPLHFYMTTSVTNLLGTLNLTEITKK
jgi:hypothetical protein